MRISEVMANYVQRSILRGGSSTPGNTVRSAIDFAVYNYLKTVRPGNKVRRIVKANDFVYNLVLAYVNRQKAEQDNKTENKERTYGTVLITSARSNTGFLLEEKKNVIFETTRPVLIGETYEYRRQGSRYIVAVDHNGIIGKTLSKVLGMPHNTLARYGDQAGLYQYEENIAESSVSFRNTGLQSVPVDRHIWHRTSGIYAHFEGKIYRESATPDGEALPGMEIDCSAYMLDAQSNTSFSHAGISYTKTYSNTRVMKILFYGKFRFVIVGRFYGTYRTSQGADFTEVAVYDLLLLNTETGLVVKFGPSHAAWSGLVCPNGMQVGYVDIQINKANGKLLLMKSAMTPSTTILNVKYYTYTEPQDPLYDHTTAATVYQIPFTLEEVVLNLDGNDFVLETLLYSHDGIVSEVDGVSVVGGIMSSLFTQQPESHKIYIGRYLVAYKQDDTVPTTYDERQIAYRVLSHGRIEFYGLTEATVLNFACSFAAGTQTTANVADQTTLVVPFYLTASKLAFIDRYLPSLNRSGTAGFTPFYQHLGAGYTGRPNNTSTYSTYSGNTVINMSYPAIASSKLNDDRFLAITDGINVKFMIQTFRINVYTPTITSEEGGYFFFKWDTDMYEAGVLDAIMPEISPYPTGSQRQYGAFYAWDDNTLIEYTEGYNNCATMQISDSKVFMAVSRCEVIDYLESGNWSIVRKPKETHYESYLCIVGALDGAITMTKLNRESVSHDLTEVLYLDKWKDLLVLGADVALFSVSN